MLWNRISQTRLEIVVTYCPWFWVFEKDIIDREISTIVPDPVDSMAIGEVPNNAAIAVGGSRL